MQRGFCASLSTVKGEMRRREECECDPVLVWLPSCTSVKRFVSSNLVPNNFLPSLSPSVSAAHFLCPRSHLSSSAAYDMVSLFQFYILG